MGSVVKLHVDVRGEGPPVLLLHGFAGSARNWGPQARALRDRYRTIAYDARGHARSEAPPAPSAYDAAALVSDGVRILAEQGVGRAVWVGLSMGAAVALEAALRAPEAVRALVLASLPAGRGGGGISAHAQEFAEAIERDGIEAAGERFAFGPGAGLTERDSALVRQGFLEHTPHGLAGALRGFLAPWPPVRERAAELERVRVPTLLLAGERDAPSVRASRDLAAILPAAQLAIVPDAGHVVNLQQPAAFNAALVEFLATAAGASR
jgi:2-succinyl-6-hydroxy-2,4-cyclohexadiene-1-carboxylate synthase